MKIVRIIALIILVIGAVIFWAAAGYDYLSSTNSINQILGTSNWYFQAAITRAGFAMILTVLSIILGKAVYKETKFE